MLANALFCTALITLIASTVLSAGVAMTRAAIYRAAGAYVPAGYQRAVQAVQTVLAADMRGGGLPSPLPSFTPLPAACVDPSCKFSAGESVQFTTVNLATPSPVCDTAQTNCASGEQGNAYVDEGRITARITVAVTTASGDALVTKSADVAFRTLRRAPYVTIAGFRDGGFDDVASADAPGDDGGVPETTPDPCASVTPGTADDTAIRVAYQNARSSACSDGNIFRAQSYSQAPSGAAGWSP